VMTAHVAQFFTDDDEWGELLRALHNALVPGGRLAFDSRYLLDAGFVVEHIFGGWKRNPIGHADGELIVLARRE
jgi:hypothetical protein